jgi:ubiquinone/menaquinone biosynthesis C-methylase UbiE
MNCDPIARAYRWLEYLVFGRRLERRRRAYLDAVANARRVLILGDGDGRFTAEFLSRNPLAQADSVDLSAKMLQLAEQRIRNARLDPARIRFLFGDARTIQLSGKYDLVVSHFFLDCFTALELQALIAQISAVMCPHARWLISEFQLPSDGIRRLAAALLIKIMYLFFRLFTGLQPNHLSGYPAIFAANGFRRIASSQAAGGLLVSELWERTS